MSGLSGWTTAKISGFSFNDLFNNSGGGFNMNNINGGGYNYGNSYVGGGGIDELNEISRCIALGLAYPCDGSGAPVNNYPTSGGVIWNDGSGVPTNTGGGNNPSGGGGGSDSGLSWLDKILGLTGLAINKFGNNNNQQYPINQQPLILPSNPDPKQGALENTINTLFNTIASNPLIVLLLIGGGALLLMPSPRSSKNGILKLIPNPKKRKTKRRR